MPNRYAVVEFIHVIGAWAGGLWRSQQFLMPCIRRRLGGMCQAAGVPNRSLVIDDTAAGGAAPLGAERCPVFDFLEVVWPGALLQYLEVALTSASTSLNG